MNKTMFHNGKTELLVEYSPDVGEIFARYSYKILSILKVKSFLPYYEVLYLIMNKLND